MLIIGIVLLLGFAIALLGGGYLVYKNFRVIGRVLLLGFAMACVWGGGYIAYRHYKASQPPSFAAERFMRLCRPQAEAEIAALKRERRNALGLAQNTYHYADASTPEQRSQYHLDMEFAQTAYDEVRMNGVFSRDGYLARNADRIGRMDDMGGVHSSIQQTMNLPDDAPQKAVELCMLKGKLAELEGTKVGDEQAGVPPAPVKLPLKENEMRVAFQNDCGAVMSSSASKSALDDTVWMGACNFGLAHGKGLRQWRSTLTPVTYFYGYDITPGQHGGDGATGNPAEIAARFKPLEAARLQKLRAMFAATSQNRGR
jgi:hypothetical protein